MSIRSGDPKRVWSRRMFLTAIGGGLAAVPIVRLGGDSRRGSPASEGDGPSPSDPSGAASPARTRTARVERRDLVRTTEIEGTLGYGRPVTIRAAGGGTITALPDVGTTVPVGTPLYEVDGGPGPVLMAGTRPMWRSLRRGVDDGPDVRQLEENLVGFGFGDERLEVDDRYDARTVDAVRDWQALLGREPTGRVEPNDVWFHEFSGDGLALRVRRHLVPLGALSDGEVIELTGTERLVRASLAADESDLAEPGRPVAVEFPDGTETGGTLRTAVAGAAPSDDGGGGGGGEDGPTIDVEILLDRDVELPEDTPVTVRFVTDDRRDVLAVPVQAVLATVDGGFALEVVASDGLVRSVPIELGRFADGWVEVDGAIAEGDEVVTA